MAIFGGSLADGQLAGTQVAILTVPADRIYHVAHVTLCNTSGSAVTVNLFIKRDGSTARRIIDKDKSVGAGEAYEVPMGQSARRLSEGDVIEAVASTADVVDFLIDGGIEIIG